MNAPQTGRSATPDANELGTASDIFVQIKGRIKGSERLTAKSGKQYIRTLIIKPAKDAYSHPSTFCVFSEFQLAADNSDVDLKCELRPSFRKGMDGRAFHNVNLWRAEH
jgi:hypothetical protein